jgi:hypothetical protein
MSNQVARRGAISSDHARRCRYERDEGTYCRANAQAESPYCFFHDPALVEQRATARRAGGIARTQRVVLPGGLPIKRLQTAAELVELLGETINQVRRGEMDLRISNAIGYLSGILLSAIEKSSYEERLAALEAAVANSSRPNTELLDEDNNFDFVQHSSPEPSSPNAQTETPDPN